MYLDAVADKAARYGDLRSGRLRQLYVGWYRVICHVVIILERHAAGDVLHRPEHTSRRGAQHKGCRRYECGGPSKLTNHRISIGVLPMIHYWPARDPLGSRMRLMPSHGRSR